VRSSSLERCADLPVRSSGGTRLRRCFVSDRHGSSVRRCGTVCPTGPERASAGEKRSDGCRGTRDLLSSGRQATAAPFVRFWQSVAVPGSEDGLGVPHAAFCNCSDRPLLAESRVLFSRQTWGREALSPVGTPTAPPSSVSYPSITGDSIWRRVRRGRTSDGPPNRLHRDDRQAPLKTARYTATVGRSRDCTGESRDGRVCPTRRRG